MQIKQQVFVALIIAIFTGGAIAQEASSGLEEVIVTGFRGSLQRGLEAKRASDKVGDFIVAEDIADFADQSLAEAITRIPGITTDDAGSFGTNIQIRGISQNSQLVNGRAIRGAKPTTAGDRFLEISSISAELLQRIEVYKTPSAVL